MFHPNVFLLYFFSLIFASRNEPTNFNNWGLTERPYYLNIRRSGDVYQGDEQSHDSVFRQYNHNHNSRQYHPWHDYHFHRRHDGPVTERVLYRDEGKAYHSHRNPTNHGEEGNYDSLSRRIYDESRPESGPQSLGYAETKNTEKRIRQMHKPQEPNQYESNLRKNRSTNKLTKKNVGRQRRDEEGVEVSEVLTTNQDIVTTTDVETKASETNSENGEETSRAIDISLLSGNFGGKRPNTSQGGKGSTHRGSSKPRFPTVPSSNKRNLTMNGIVFPDNPMFLPKNTDCSPDATYCEESSDYPREYIRELLRSEGDKFEGIFGQDTILESNITERVYRDETPLCAANKKLIFPMKAKDKSGKYLFIINQDGHKQGVVAETCSKPEGECMMTSGFPTSYITSCKQKYATRRLLSLNGTGGAGMNEFIFPSCCVCMLHFVGVNPLSKPKS